jgi:hypothetical protein
LVDDHLKTLANDLWTSDRPRQNGAFKNLMAVTEQPVDWAYQVWDQALANLTHTDNHNRAIAAQLLCNLAISDPDGRMLQDFPAVLAVTRDQRFVTARHSLQSLWKVGLAGGDQLRLLLTGYETRFEECLDEKNWSLIRYDILAAMRKLYDQTQSPAIKTLAFDLIEREADGKYKKKYQSAWRNV